MGRSGTTGRNQYASITSNTAWAPSYLFSVANNHNALGRFYETWGNNGYAEHDAAAGARARSWRLSRPRGTCRSPPYKTVCWSIRNNVNYQQTADLTAMHTVATYRDDFLRNFWKRGFDSYRPARTRRRTPTSFRRDRRIPSIPRTWSMSCSDRRSRFTGAVAADVEGGHVPGRLVRRSARPAVPRSRGQSARPPALPAEGPRHQRRHGVDARTRHAGADHRDG